MFIDGDILTAETPPSEFKYRDAELDELRRAFDPLTNNPTAPGAFIYGPTGVGKTTTARHLLDRLEAAVDGMAEIYIHGFEFKTRAAILHQIVSEIPDVRTLARDGTASDEYLAAIRDTDLSLVIVLDEADAVEDTEVFRDLYQNQSISPLLIVNSEREFRSRLQNRILSRLAELYPIQFSPYQQSTLVSIMEDRAREALDRGVADRRVLASIADRAAGDARLALRVLLNAARKADVNGRTSVTEADIDAALPDARQDIRAEVYESLSTDQRALLVVLDDVGRCGMMELEEGYSERVSGSKSRRTLQKYLSKLREYDMVQFHGPKNQREYSLERGVDELLGDEQDISTL